MRKIIKNFRKENTWITKIREVYQHKMFDRYLMLIVLDHGSEVRLYAYITPDGNHAVPISRDEFIAHTGGDKERTRKLWLSIDPSRELNKLPKDEW